MQLLRPLLLALFAANLLFLLWHLVRGPAVSHERREGVSDSLIHITELTDSQKLIAQEVLPDELSIIEELPPTEGQAGACYLLGSFADEAEARFWAESGAGISIGAYQIVNREQPGAGAPMFRALIPALPDRDEAVARLAEVREAIAGAGARIDTYLVTSGPMVNSISLGLFGEQANALNVQRVLAAEGVNVSVQPEIRLENRYWVAVYPVDSVDMYEEIAISRGLEMVSPDPSENLCETIAQAE